MRTYFLHTRLNFVILNFATNLVKKCRDEKIVTRRIFKRKKIYRDKNIADTDFSLKI